MSRRSVLTWIGIGAGTAAIAAGAGIGVRAASNGACTAGLGTPYALWREWAALSGVERVVAAGVLACNPHNAQPWRLGVSSEVIQIRSDPSRRMPINDASAREHFAGLGCAIENMMIAASAAGLGSVARAAGRRDERRIWSPRSLCAAPVRGRPRMRRSPTPSRCGTPIAGRTPASRSAPMFWRHSASRPPRSMAPDWS